MKTNNLLLLADAYKYSHYKLYPAGTTKIFSYLESRGGLFNETVFFGLHYYLKEYLEGQAFTKENIDEAEELMNGVFGVPGIFSRSNFEYILHQYGGQLPVRIKAVKEGVAVPVNNVLLTIENTDPKCFWLTNFLETLLMQIWYPSTVATLSHEIRKVFQSYYLKTVDEGSFGGMDFSLNDFGFRGVSSVESAGLGGAAHLISFMGSDTVYASALAKKYYHAQSVFGKSVPATEHSIMTILGKDGEKETFQHVLSAYPQGILACVSDSFDVFHATKELWGGTLKESVLQRKGTLVIRPDSGDPIQTLSALFEILFDRFGFTVNQKGYRVLPPQVRVIQGDGVDYESIQLILESLTKKGIAAENIIFGMGGALLQKINRDTQKFAMKCSYAEVNGSSYEVKKSPVEMNGQGELIASFKTSKAGRLKLIKQDQRFRTVTENESGEDELDLVFENGEIKRSQSFEEIRELSSLTK